MVYVYVVLLALAFMKVSVVPVLNIPKMSHLVSEPEMDWLSLVSHLDIKVILRTHLIELNMIVIMIWLPFWMQMLNFISDDFHVSWLLGSFLLLLDVFVNCYVGLRKKMNSSFEVM